MKEILKQIKFIHILTIFVSASVFAFDVMLCFHDIPKENKSIVDFIAGVLNGTCLGGALAYWYSTTATSKEKTDKVIDMAINTNPEKPKV